MQMELRAALMDRSSRRNERTRSALTALCAVAHAENMQMEHLVAALKRAWTDAPAPAELTEEEWHERYSAALVELLAMYFGEAT